MKNFQSEKNTCGDLVAVEKKRIFSSSDNNSSIWWLVSKNSIIFQYCDKKSEVWPDLKNSKMKGNFVAGKRLERLKYTSECCRDVRSGFEPKK